MPPIFFCDLSARKIDFLPCLWYDIRGGDRQFDMKGELYDKDRF